MQPQPTELQSSIDLAVDSLSPKQQTRMDSAEAVEYHRMCGMQATESYIAAYMDPLLENLCILIRSTNRYKPVYKVLAGVYKPYKLLEKRIDVRIQFLLI